MTNSLTNTKAFTITFTIKYAEEWMNRYPRNGEEITIETDNVEEASSEFEEDLANFLCETMEQDEEIRELAMEQYDEDDDDFEDFEEFLQEFVRNEYVFEHWQVQQHFSAEVEEDSEEDSE